MNIEYLIANWLLERLKSDNLISESLSDDVMKRFLANHLGSKENSELEGKVA